MWCCIGHKVFLQKKQISKITINVNIWKQINSYFVQHKICKDIDKVQKQKFTALSG